MLFATFIFSCGIGHIVAAWNIWHVDYWFEGIEKFTTALISIYTAIKLKHEIPRFLGLQKALEDTEDLVGVDTLTGLFSRRILNEAVTKAITIVKTEGISHTLMMLDLDDFKRVNDTYGHVVGDHLLMRVGEVLQQNTRSSLDLVARLGGDEFAILLSHCTLLEAIPIAEKMRMAIGEIQLPEENFTAVGVSIGLAPVQGLAELEDIYNATDKALYDSKRAGKNKVSCATVPNIYS